MYDKFEQLCLMSNDYVYQNSLFFTMYDRQDDYDLDEDNEEYMEEDRDAEDQDDSDEGIGVMYECHALTNIAKFKSQVQDINRNLGLYLES